MKRSLWAAILWLVAQPAWSVDWLPHVEYADRHFEYTSGPGQLNGTTFSLGLGLTATHERFYLDLTAERNFSASEESTSGDLIPNSVADTVTFDRRDTALTLGYGVSELTSVFAGYKSGKTTITAAGNSPFVGNAISLTGAGPFIGAGAGWKVRDWGILSFSAAYADLDAEYSSPVQLAQGQASGTSLALHWKGELLPRLQYRIALSRHDYDYKNFDQFTGRISENILSYTLGISYRF